MNKYLLGVSLSLLLLFNYFLAAPEKREREVNSLLFVNPVLARALSGNLHTLLADSLWLSLAMVSETGVGDSRKVDIERFYQTNKTLIFMDGNFYKAVAYGSTFLVSIYNEIQKAHDLIHLSRLFDPKNFKLYFLEIINIVTYEHASQKMMASVIELANQALKIPEDQRNVSLVDSSQWIKDALAFSQDALAKKQKKREDLLWLLKQTKEPQKRRLIEKQLQELH